MRSIPQGVEGLQRRFPEVDRTGVATGSANPVVTVGQVVQGKCLGQTIGQFAQHVDRPLSFGREVVQQLFR